MPAPLKRLILATATVIVWAAITLGSARLQVSSTISLQSLITSHLAWGVGGAGLFLVLVSWLAGWRDLGFRSPRPWRSLLLLWLPALYLLALGATGLVTGKLQAAALLMVLVNTAMVGFSEELAFRGVLWGAVRRAMPFWPGFLIVSMAFGSVHVFNAILTGELAAAGVQALNAFMSGCAYLAIRIRTRSIVPIMVIHAAWDFVIFLIGSGGDHAPTDTADIGMQLVFGILLTGPLFLYGLWLVRNEKVRGGWRDDSPDPSIINTGANP